MKRSLIKIFTFAMLIGVSLNTSAQSQLIKNLKAGRPQTLVTYGTSLTAAVGGKAWVDSVHKALSKQYPGLLKTVNAAKSGMWSTWGVQHLEDSVIKKAPDAVLMEFGMNDAFMNYKTSVDVARLNLNYTIDRIKLANPSCEVILQIMNIPLDKHAEQRPDLLAYYQMYREVAKKRKLLLIDHYPHWKALLDKGRDEYLKAVSDGIHPDVIPSTNIIAPYVLERLNDKP
ncbi:SGNH/GDSL hydrolase family protein [Mucilaginibacter myungsuensis]|uniref:SGNH/GDSL hydrolase family protein n=1 Tax=Mucilaginibacter myungsuensis TaxID=649104 RepID=A0A929PYM7_9SPHI|nr:GDSL-type esterase/lipase family protein [Mucilaginibacter myungsuensis]MBE9663487.1 SGNH/GDSL hydrolase family protein [Mucilaginibacter myungsuensis]MDN3600225.1 GDSL-type esterase/lipase family protein [Mucilaginibacter myungsuensis]